MVSVNFGNTNIASRHSVGKLECSGRVLVTGIPASCRDLQLLGHTVSGIYSVKRPQKNVDSVYCDFSKSSDTTGPNFVIIGENSITRCEKCLQGSSKHSAKDHPFTFTFGQL